MREFSLLPWEGASLPGADQLQPGLQPNERACSSRCLLRPESVAFLSLTEDRLELIQRERVLDPMTGSFLIHHLHRSHFQAIETCRQLKACAFSIQESGPGSRTIWSFLVWNYSSTIVCLERRGGFGLSLWNRHTDSSNGIERSTDVSLHSAQSIDLNCGWRRIKSAECIGDVHDVARSLLQKSFKHPCFAL